MWWPFKSKKKEKGQAWKPAGTLFSDEAINGPLSMPGANAFDIQRDFAVGKDAERTAENGLVADPFGGAGGSILGTGILNPSSSPSPQADDMPLHYSSSDGSCLSDSSFGEPSGGSTSGDSSLFGSSSLDSASSTDNNNSSDGGSSSGDSSGGGGGW